MRTTTTITALLALSLIACHRRAERHLQPSNPDSLAQQIWACYAQRLEENPKLAGDVVLSFAVATTGHAHDAHIVQTKLGDPETELCMVAAANKWSVAPPPDQEIPESKALFRFRPDAGELKQLR